MGADSVASGKGTKAGEAKTAVVFVHGFMGKDEDTWAGFPSRMKTLAAFDSHFWGTEQKPPAAARRCWSTSTSCSFVAEHPFESVTSTLQSAGLNSG